MIVAGEASGDLHGAHLVREMRAVDPSIAFCGVGGRNLEAEGVRLIARSSEMAVVGLTEVFSKLRFIAGVFFRLRGMLRAEKPDLLILIDYPDFNLRLAAAAKDAGVPVFYYISPQVWAWRKKRVHRIRRIVDRMAVILPFEKDVYAEMGVDVDFVGHPLLDAVTRTRSRGEALAAFGLRDARPIVAILPGSREKEVTALLPEMAGAAEILARDFEGAQFVLPLADTVDPALVEGILRGRTVPVTVLQGQMYDAVGISDAAMVASGTATLETALLGTPMVIAYRISPLTAAVGRRVIRVTHIGLVNLIAGRTLAPELVQESATAPRLAAEVKAILADGRRSDAMRRELAEIRQKLGEPGAARRAASIALGLMGKSLTHCTLLIH
ncbi:MAG: Lipid-A-disaccharide synthase [Syntrophaceae bacterium PtaB.Bin038]|nr:MAG: Lipid-A-disaccharide synthase [Syntrophaceae bacterium PtaB.Bin038]